MKKMRAWLATAILAAITIRVVYWATEPLLPILLITLFLLLILGFIIHRTLFW